MLKMLTFCFVVVALFSSIFVVAAPSVAAYDVGGEACKQQPGSAGCPTAGGDPAKIIAKAAAILSIIGGIAAVMAVMYGGFTYVTSNGDASKAGKGRQIITYALIGLVVIVIAPSLIAYFAGKM